MRTIFCPGWLLGALLLPLAALGYFRSIPKKPGTIPPGSLRAYSLRSARARLMPHGPKPAEVCHLGGLTRLLAVVVDETAGASDVILVGETRPGEKPLDLDDLVVVLRAVLVGHEYPGCSIDRTPTSSQTKQQTIRFIGEIANSALAAQLLSGDVVLKRLALAQLSCAAWKGQSYFSMRLEDAELHGPRRAVGARWWFRPLSLLRTTREGVFSIDDVRMGVSTEFYYRNNSSGSSSPGLDRVAAEFGQSLTTHIEQVAAQYPEVRRLQALMGLVAVAKGIRELPAAPDLKWWLRDYPVPVVKTPTTFPLICREATTQSPGGRVRVLVEGGVDLEPLLVEWETARDVVALRRLVLATRPGPAALTWNIPQRAEFLARAAGPGIARPQGRQGEPRSYQLGCTVDAAVVPFRERASGITFDAQARLLTGARSFQIVDPSSARKPWALSQPPPGGVLINPAPAVESRGGAALRRQLLRARPAEDPVSFDTPISLPPDAGPTKGKGNVNVH
jgi:hypothetical protein